jgi:hypothetical protein
LIISSLCVANAISRSIATNCKMQNTESIMLLKHSTKPHKYKI